MSRAFGLDRTLWWAVAALAVMLALFEFTSFDLWVQDWFFDFETRSWLVDRDNSTGRALFYTGPKLVIIALVTMLVAWIGVLLLRRVVRAHRETPDSAPSVATV